MPEETEVIDAEVAAPTALAVLPQRPLAGLELWEPETLRAMIKREIELREIMLEYMRGQMKRGQHYYTRQDFGRREGEEASAGGDDKPSLKKEGPLNLCHLLHCRPVVAHRDETFHPDGHYTVTTTVHLISLRTGEIVGEGEGLCTTRESKYAWRWLWPSQLPETERVGLVTKSLKPKKGPNKGKWVTLYRVANTSLADLFNTVLKLSYKRGLVAGVLTLPLASELFTQDVEDLAEEDEDGSGFAGFDADDLGGGEPAGQRRPATASTGAPMATPAPGTVPAGEPLWTTEQVEHMPASQVNDALAKRLRYLAPDSKDDRIGYIRTAFGEAASRWGEVEPLGLRVRKAALVKLLAMKKDAPPLVDDDDDVPLGDAAEAHLSRIRAEGQPAATASSPPGATISPTDNRRSRARGRSHRSEAGRCAHGHVWGG